MGSSWFQPTKPYRCSLVFDSFSLDFLLWLVFVEEVGFSSLLSWQLFSGEVSDVELFSVNTFQGDSGRGSNDVTSVDSSQWNTVNLEWTGNQQGVVFQVLQVDNSLTSETTSQQNQDGTWDQGGTQLLWSSGLSGLLWSWDFFSWIPLLSLYWKLNWKIRC